jgi:hypothetical protein
MLVSLLDERQSAWRGNLDASTKREYGLLNSRRICDGSKQIARVMFCKMTPEERNALAVLGDAVDRCRQEDMRTAEVFASLDLLARRTSTRWPFEQFKESLNFAVGDPSHAEGRWQNVHASLNAIRRATLKSREH